MDFTNIPKDLLDKIEREIFTVDDIDILINYYLNQLNIKEYCKEVTFRKRWRRDRATYTFETFDMKVYYEGILNCCKKEYKETNTSLILYSNIYILCTIIHEIVHVYQNCSIKNFIPLYSIHREELIILNGLKDETYIKYYNYFIFEREADVISYENILIIIRRYLHNEELFNYYLELLKELLLVGYRFRNKVFVSPIEILYKDIVKKEVPTIEGINTYDTISLGLQISHPEYKSFKHDCPRIILEKNNLNS